MLRYENMMALFAAIFLGSDDSKGRTQVPRRI